MVVILMVKKKDGMIEDIRIEWDEVILDELFVCFVMVDFSDGIIDIGYIKFFKFYFIFDGGNSCVVDIKIEVEKL